MKKWTQSKYFGQALLVCTTLIWGLSFVVVKNVFDVMTTNYINTFRFGIAAIGMILIFWNRIRKDRLKALLPGMLIGGAIFAAYTIQNYGLMYTTAGKNAFLTTAYVIFVPLFYSLVYRKLPKWYHLAAAGLGFLGVGLLSLNADFSIGIGEGLSFLCGIFYAIQILLVARFGKNYDIFVMTAYMFLTTAILSFLLALFTEPAPTFQGSSQVLQLLYLGLIGTLLALFMQNLGQKTCPPQSASLIMSLESVFGTIFGILFLAETITSRFFIGSAFILFAILICETQFQFLRKRGKIRKNGKPGRKMDV